MSSLGNDLTSVLNCFVKRKSIGEIKFDEKQKESGLKICEQLIHEHSNKENGKDKLKIITQLSHVSDNCDTPIASNDKMVFTSKEDSLERNQNSPQISDFYLKSQLLSHVKSKSLDNDHNRDLSDCHKTEITTVVGDCSSNYERVHNTTFIHSMKGNTIEKEHSFTRPVASSISLSNSRPSSYYSLPSQMNGNTLMLSSGKHYKSHKKKLRKFKWKRFFSTSKSQKTKETLKDIDKLVLQEYSNLSATPKHERQDSKKSSLTININQTIPFKSHTIGEKLQPLSKKNMSKKIPDFFQLILRPQHFLPKSGSKNHNSKNQTHKIDADQMGCKKAWKFVAEVSKQGENENFNYRINSSDLIDSPDGKDESDEHNPVFLPDTNNNRQRTVSDNVSICHFDMLSKVKERRPSCPNTRRIQCACHERRIELMVDVLHLCLNKRKDEKIMCQKKNEIKDFDVITGHFVDCDMMKILNERNHTISHYDETLSQSLASLYSLNPCLHCDEDTDEQLDGDVSTNLLPLLEQMENEDEINCPIETLEYFLQATCYKHFEKGLLHVIGPQCTVKNVALWHYLTKRIVKHIGDPTEDDNKKIQKILKISKDFFYKHYYPHIKNIHKTMDSFLISCNDNEDVD